MDLENTSLKRRSDFGDIQRNSSTSAKRLRLSRDEISTVRGSVDYFAATFPLDRLDYAFPPVVFRHQLYSTLPLLTRTEINREIDLLQKRNAILVFKIDPHSDELLMIRSDDYREHVRGFVRDHRLRDYLILERFLDHVHHFDITVTKGDLTTNGATFSDLEIQVLVAVGVLVHRDVGAWWLSFPGVGQFMRALQSGRDKLLKMVRTAKNSTVLESGRGRGAGRGGPGGEGSHATPQGMMLRP
ncbi:putative Serine/threonine-protein kinase 19 [Hypsibius exemplaris]|uniref:Serine/threonine-protein kinase 19 n=1 Tax=Hypsibius exemplaris TaxID=2072580 RepID=A0A1W0WAJ9_HYPEX|nr:putative Serine/threonine-protein kinase 19 [Hypsibius exemplaris]